MSAGRLPPKSNSHDSLVTALIDAFSSVSSNADAVFLAQHSLAEAGDYLQKALGILSTQGKEFSARPAQPYLRRYRGMTADDVTGATDAAVAFRRQGLRVGIYFGLPDPGVIQHDLDATVIALKIPRIQSRLGPSGRSVTY